MKKALSLVLAALMIVFCFAGCGGKKSNTEYFIGATGPLTGDNASYGTSVKKGATLAVKEINANGGLNGVKFKFEIKK